MTKKIPVAIAYDFDGTLARGNMQEHSLFSALEISKDCFWKEVKTLCKQNDMDEILAYMHKLTCRAECHGGIKRTVLEEHAKGLPFFLGVDTWFSRINKFSEKLKIELNHYIISSGLREMIQASKIGHEFQYIWASEFMYDNDGMAIWPALAINYTTKTQYLFRINKGVLNSHENKPINEYRPDHRRKIPFTNMIYIGDGDNDVPSMKMMKHQGGKSIAVYDPDLKEKKEHECKLLQLQDRVNYYAEADYREGSHLDKIIKDIIAYISNNY